LRDQARARDSLAATGLRLNGSGGQSSTEMKAVVISLTTPPNPISNVVILRVFG
jgi:hypothetical protein